MNDVIAALGIESWKPLLTALALPPVPFIVLILIGARLILPRRNWGWTLILAGVAGIWLMSTNGFAVFLTAAALRPPPPISEQRIALLAAGVKARQPVAIIVLGGGREAVAPEYGTSNLTPQSAERLRYGMWLARRTGAPVGFSGGIGWSEQEGGASEAEVASRIASEEYLRPLKWVEPDSRDTRENASHMLSVLRPAGIRQVILVTNGYHMPRAIKRFQEASMAARAGIEFIPAPMGLSRRSDAPWLDWVPSTSGFTKTRNALREVLALVVG